MPTICHAYSWVIAVLLFCIMIFIPLKTQILIWLFRASYASVIVSGTILLSRVFTESPVTAIIKTIASLSLLGIMEYIIYKKNKKDSIQTLVGILLIVAAIVVFIGHQF
ncbi:MAG: hypothetical protein K0R71_351 [Bacillales bacterium]|nr:hypothetical protein [Bacillales bacterium]